MLAIIIKLPLRHSSLFFGAPVQTNFFVAENFEQLPIV